MTTVWVCGHESNDGGSVYAVVATRELAERWIAAKLDEQRAMCERQIAFGKERGYENQEETWVVSRVARAEDEIAFTAAGMDTYYARLWEVDE